MSNTLTTRDGLIGNSPRYTGHVSPAYQKFLKDDGGAVINLTGVLPAAFALLMVNQSNPLSVKTGAGTFSVIAPATQGLMSYAYAANDLASAGNWYLFITVALTGEASPRVFDPDLLTINLFPSSSGGGVSLTTQDVNLLQVNGATISASNPVPVSGPVTTPDGGNVAIGTTTDASTANTTIGLLKAIKAYLGGTLTTNTAVTSLPALPAGTAVIGHVIVDSAGAVSVTSLPALPAGTNVIGHVIIDSASSVSVTALPALPTGANTIGNVGLVAGSALVGTVELADSAGVNKLVIDASGNASMKLGVALPAGTNVIGHVVVDSAGSVSVTSLPTLPAGTNVIGHVIVDSASSVSVTSLPALPAGTNVIGHVIIDSASSVSVTALPALATGANTIGNVGLIAGSAVIGSTTIQAVSGTALLSDQAGTILRASNYGKSSTAGDTPILVDSTGRSLIGRSTAAAYTQTSITTSGATQNSADIPVGSYTELSIDINTTAQAGTSPTIQYFYERKGADNIYYVLWQSAVLTIAANTLSTSIGAGMAYNQSLGLTGRLRWVIGGSATPTFTHSINIYGK
jgi:hypothetical protein